MKTAAFALSTLLLLVAAPLTTAAEGDTVNVTLQVTLGNHLLPAYAECGVGVAVGSNAGDVLDAAVDEGCIDSWEYEEFGGFGRYVTCIDGICAPFGTFWALFVDETVAASGIDSTIVEEGQTIEFVLSDWFTPFTGL